MASILDTLTAREGEVLHRVALGEPNKKIAYRLHVTVRTVERHVTSILEKLGVESRTEAAVLYTRITMAQDASSDQPQSTERERDAA